MNANRATCLAALALAVLLPARARPLALLEDEALTLTVPLDPAATRIAAAGAGPAARAKPDLHAAEQAPQEAKKDPFDFDLLGEAPRPAAPQEDPSLRTRRKLLNLHQGLGLGLLGLQLASTVTGQLNYDDKFSVDDTGRYKLTHKVITYTNLAAFAVTGAVALFAPGPKGPRPEGVGRTTIHKIFMGLATAGMVGQGLLGIETARREGNVDQQSYARKHLVLGYATLAFVTIGVGALVF